MGVCGQVEEVEQVRLDQPRLSGFGREHGHRDDHAHEAVQGSMKPVVALVLGDAQGDHRQGPVGVHVG